MYTWILRLARSLKFVALALACYWALIFVATHIPISVDAPGMHLDKVVHAVTYAGLAFLLVRALSLRWGASMKVNLCVLGIAACYGAIDELLQIPIPGRQGDLKDWIADMLGATAGIGTYIVASKWGFPWLKKSWRSWTQTQTATTPISPTTNDEQPTPRQPAVSGPAECTTDGMPETVRASKVAMANQIHA